MSFRSEARSVARKAGGSYKTVDAREAVASRLADFLQKENIQIRDLAHLKTSHVEKFAAARLKEGVSPRTLSNELSSVRVILREAGRGKLADNLDNKALGAAGGSREGTKTAISDERLATLRAVVLAKDEGVARVIDLQRALGLRAEEGVKAYKSLATWERKLTNGEPVRVIYGTKGGRPRDVWPSDPARALATVQAARELAKRQAGVLIAKPDERTAMNRYRYVMSKSGFVKKEAGHSLRYSFAQEQLANYPTEGYSKNEVRSLTSQDLGHGDGRGRYVERVYSK